MIPPASLCMPNSHALGNTEIIFPVSHLATPPPAVKPFQLRFFEMCSVAYILPISWPKPSPDCWPCLSGHPSDNCREQDHIWDQLDGFYLTFTCILTLHAAALTHCISAQILLYFVPQIKLFVPLFWKHRSCNMAYGQLPTYPEIITVAPLWRFQQLLLWHYIRVGESHTVYL